MFTIKGRQMISNLQGDASGVTGTLAPAFLN